MIKTNIKNTYKYKMTKECFKNIVATRKGNELSMNPYVYAIRYINEEYGLLGTCIGIMVY